MSRCRPLRIRSDYVLATLTSLLWGLGQAAGQMQMQKTDTTEIDGGTNSFTETVRKVKARPSLLCSCTKMKRYWLTAALMVIPLHSIMALLEK